MIGRQASIAVHQIFEQLGEAGYRCHYTDTYSETLACAVGFNLEAAAGRVIQDQLSDAILASWVRLRRASQSECDIEESIGGLFSAIAGIVASLIFEAVPDLGELVGPAVPSEEQARYDRHDARQRHREGTQPVSTIRRSGNLSRGLLHRVVDELAGDQRAILRG